MKLEAVRPRSTLLRRSLVWTLRATLCSACCFASAKCGAAAEAKRAAAIDRPLPVERVQGRGELWLRCPSSTTWYSYAGDRRGTE